MCFISKYLRGDKLSLTRDKSTKSKKNKYKILINFLKFLFIVYPTAMPLPPVSMGESTPPAPPSVPLPSPMANLMSITETLPPGSPRSGPSPPGPPPPRSASRGSQHSPNSSGKFFITKKKFK